MGAAPPPCGRDVAARAAPRNTRCPLPLETVGPTLFAVDGNHRLLSRIATLFLEQRVLWTGPPFVHSGQREAFVDLLNARRSAAGLPPLSPPEVNRVYSEAVDLIIDPRQVRIRPRHGRMDLAFAADELLEEVVSKLQVRFVNVSDPEVREAIKARGECWRVDAVPTDDGDRRALIQNAKRAIGGRPIYYHNSLSGTRWLTFQEFCGLGELGDAELRSHLAEIAAFTVRRNLQERPEVDFFGADTGRFGPKALADARIEGQSAAELRRQYEAWREAFRAATPPALRADDFACDEWRRAMLSALFVHGDETVIGQVLTGLSPEFEMQVRWLPGGRFDAGAFVLDPVYTTDVPPALAAERKLLCDPLAKNIVHNFIREYGDLEGLNIGRVSESLKRELHENTGRRAVYLAELRIRREPQPVKRILRLLKWGVWEHLDEGKSMEQSVAECGEYVDYWMDRWLGCRQLGMRLPARVTMRWLTETYTGKATRHCEPPIRTPYFERSYLVGTATDRIPVANYGRPGYAEKLALLLGKAAAPSLIVGRSRDQYGIAFFDHGDELVREGSDGLPEEVLAVRHIGSFRDYESRLEDLAGYYVHPVENRLPHLPDPGPFAGLYLDALRQEIGRIQQRFRAHRRSWFDLFDRRRIDVRGSFACRWAAVLRRLDEADPNRIADAIRGRLEEGPGSTATAGGAEDRFS